MKQSHSKNALRIHNLTKLCPAGEPPRESIAPSQSPKILRLPAVIEKLGIARTTIYDWLNPKSPRYNPTFPRQVQLGQKSVGWLESDLDQWLLARSTSVH